MFIFLISDYILVAFILNIDTTTAVCSVVLSENERVVSVREDTEGRSHASLLTVFIDEIAKESNIKPDQLDAVAISMGPGSYTGLRIGVSVAKGICYGISKPLIAISTLKALCYGAKKNTVFESVYNKNEKFLFCPMIDARRMDIFTALFDINYNQVSETQALTINNNSFKEELVNHRILFFGDGSEKCKVEIKNKNAYFIDNLLNSAKYMVELSATAFKKNDFVDIAYFEPYYLKDFIPTKPKKNIVPFERK